MRSCDDLHRDAIRTKLPPVGLFGRFAYGLCMASLCVITAASSPALARETSPAATRVVAYTGTGSIRFIGSAPGKPIARPTGLAATASPTRIARAFLARRASAFGIGSGARDLLLRSAHKASAGRSVVRFQQLHKGVPVFGGELVVDLDSNGNVLSAGGETLPETDLSVMPRVASLAARETALVVTARAHGVPASRLRSSEPRLWIYDSVLLGGTGLERPTLVWRTEVTGHGRRPVDELVLLDAQVGTVALHFSQIKEALQRRICDAGNTASQVPCAAPVRAEGSGRSSIRDVNDAYELTGATYDFYRSRFGRDSIDAGGMPVVATTRYCDPDDLRKQCPWPNAGWYPDAGQVAFGQGFASADDVVGHELTHAVVDHTSNLFPYYQAGAIDESIADTLGELFDQTNGRGTDTKAVRWRFGEDTPIGARRDMRQPSRFNQPDRMTSSYYDLGAKNQDAGGIHTNSGVGNKAAFLITDGGTFKGRTVRGLGVDKAARIYYELATTQLTSASDYADLYYALPQACRNLVGITGITEADCEQVAAAVSAVEMAFNPLRKAALCPGGGSTHDLFFDDLENPASGKWTLDSQGAGEGWQYPQPAEWTYAASGRTNFWGNDWSSPGTYSIAMARSVHIPKAEAVYFHFKHAYAFTYDRGSNFTGGTVEYRADGGMWTDAGKLWDAEHGYGYNGWGSFVRRSNGYGSSRAQLGSLAGENVRFRFTVHVGIGDVPVPPQHGWFIDDIRIYTCSVHPPIVAVTGPSNVTVGRSATWTIAASDPAPDDQAGVFRYTIDWNGDGRVDATVSHGNALRLHHAYRRAGRYTITVRVADHQGSAGRPRSRRIVVGPATPSRR